MTAPLPLTVSEPDTWSGEPRILGIDLSLTSTGVACIDYLASGIPTVRTITSKGRADASIEDTVYRLNRIAAAVCDMGEADPDLAVIEAPSFGSHTGSQHERGGLWWLVARTFVGRAVPVAVVTPAARAKYATGKGNAAKDAVLAAVVRRYPNVDVAGNDQADALILAAMGARWLGRPIDDVPLTHLAAMVKVRWPADRRVA